MSASSLKGQFFISEDIACHTIGAGIDQVNPPFTEQVVVLQNSRESIVRVTLPSTSMNAPRAPGCEADASLQNSWAFIAHFWRCMAVQASIAHFRKGYILFTPDYCAMTSFLKHKRVVCPDSDYWDY